MSSKKSIRRALMIARVGKADGGDVSGVDDVVSAMREGFGDSPIGLSDETKNALGTTGPSGAINAGIIQPLAYAGDAALRAANAGVYGAGRVARRAFEQMEPVLRPHLGESFGSGAQLENDIREMPAAFMGELNVPKSAARTAVDIAKKPAGAAERGMINLGSEAAPEPTYYSPLERGIAEAKQSKMSPQEWKSIASKFPKEEADWRGLHDFLDKQTGSVTRDQVLAHLKENPVDVQEVWKGAGVPSSERQIRLKAADDALTNYLVQNHKFTPQGAREFGIEIANNTLGENQTKFVHGDPELKRLSYELFDANKERQVGDYETAPKHDQPGRVLPGGENYREMLLTLPKNSSEPKRYEIKQEGDKYRVYPQGSNSWVSQHPSLDQAQKEIGARQFRDDMHNSSKNDFYAKAHFAEPNILAHVRMNDRTGPNGEKLLHLEEIQSDWHQQGKEKGYGTGYNVVNHSDGDKVVKNFPTDAEAVEYAKHNWLPENNLSVRPMNGVPDAPFKDTKDWTALALKRVMRHAADNGYHGVTWTTGAHQIDRYDLGKHVDEVHWEPDPSRSPDSKLRSGTLRAYKHDPDFYDSSQEDPTRAPPIIDQYMTEESLKDHIGKDAAERIVNKPTTKDNGVHVLSGDDLRVGGTGMKEYYDRIVPSVANKLGKEHGAQVGKTTLKLPTTEMGKRPIIPEDRVVSTSGGYTVRHPGSENMGLWDTREEAEKWLEDARLYNTEDTQVHHLPIKPSMKGRAHKMFQRGGAVNHAPSEAQKDAGNYKKEHVNFQGLDISIENKKGSIRSGKDASGKPWSCKLPADYGYIKGTEGADGDHVDVYLGPDKNSHTVFIINQHDLKGGFDEHKCLIGFKSERDAMDTYCKAFSDGKGVDRLGSLETVSMDAFKKWLKSEKTKKPAHSRNIVEHALKLVTSRGARK